MKNMLFIVAIIFAMIQGMQANAFVEKTWDEIYVTENVADDFYVAWGQIDINNSLSWDLVVAGGQIVINSEIWQDLMVLGWQISVDWSVWDDVRIAGWDVTIDSNIDGDLVVWAWSVRINKWVKIWGDLVVWAWRLIMNWEVMWKAKWAVWQLVLNGTIHWNAEMDVGEFSNPSTTGIIEWNLNYKSDKKIQALEKASKGTVVFEKSIMKETENKTLFSFFIPFIIIKLLWLFLFSILFYLYFQKFFSTVSYQLCHQIWKSFLYGFLTIIWIPFVIVLLMITVIWIPFGLLLLCWYIFMFVFLELLNVLVFTSFFVDKYNITQLHKKILVLLGLTIVFWFISGINVLVWFFTLWAIAIKKMEMLQSVRSEQSHW